MKKNKKKLLFRVSIWIMLWWSTKDENTIINCLSWFGHRRVKVLTNSVYNFVAVSSVKFCSLFLCSYCKFFIRITKNPVQEHGQSDSSLSYTFHDNWHSWIEVVICKSQKEYVSTLLIASWSFLMESRKSLFRRDVWSCDTC